MRLISVRLAGLAGLTIAATLRLGAAGVSDPQQLCPPCAAIASAQKDLDQIPAGALKDRSWALKAAGINLGTLADSRRLGAGATIVQIDTGVTDHPLLHRLDAANQGIDVTRADGIFGAGHANVDQLLSGFLRFPGHGTKTASVIAARPTGQYAGLTGVATGARLIPVRATQGVVLFSSTIGELEADQHRIAYVIDQVAGRGNGFFGPDVDVISMSLGGWPPVPALCESVKRATDAGVIVLVAAGNKVNRTKYPAKCPTAIAIAGSTFDQKPWSGSAGGPEVAVAAPAEGVWTASVVSGKYCMEASSGTSFAVALVAGMAAEWVAEKRRRGTLPASPSEAFRQALRTTARPWTGRSAKAWSRKFGSGIADMTSLMRQEQQP